MCNIVSKDWFFRTAKFFWQCFKFAHSCLNKQKVWAEYLELHEVKIQKSVPKGRHTLHRMVQTKHMPGTKQHNRTFGMIPFRISWWNCWVINADKRAGRTPQHGLGQVIARDRGEKDKIEKKAGVSYNEPWMWASYQSCLMGFIPGKFSALPHTSGSVCTRRSPGQGAARTLWPWNELRESVGKPCW